MKCNSCGNEIVNGKNYCTKCGVLLRTGKQKSESQSQSINKTKIEDKLKLLDEIYKKQKIEKSTSKAKAPPRTSSISTSKTLQLKLRWIDKNILNKVFLILFLFLMLLTPLYFFLESSRNKNELSQNKIKSETKTKNKSLPFVFKRTQEEINFRKMSLTRNISLAEREEEFMEMAQEVAYNNYKKIEEIGWLVLEYGSLSENEELRYQTSFLVSQLKDLAGIPILNTLKQDASTSVYYSTLVGLYLLGEKTVLKQIINALQEETDEALINSIIKSLMGIEVLPLQNVLLDMLANENYEIRKNAAFALGEIKREEAIYVLDEVINSDYSDEEKIKSAVLIAKMKKNSADQIIEEKIENLNDCLRLLFSFRLAELGDNQANDYINYSLEEVDEEEKINNALCLSKLDDKPAIEILKKTLQNENLIDKELLYKIALTLSEKGEKTLTIPILLQIISEEDYFLKLQTAYNIIKMLR